MVRAEQEKNDETINIFFILSPLQLMNAIEACEYYKYLDGQAKNILIISNTLNKRNNQQIDNILLIYNKWDEVKRINIYYNMKELFFHILWLSYKFKNINVSRVFLGECRIDYSWILANNANPKEIVLVDDGLGTLSISKNLTNQTGSSIKNIICKITGLKNAQRQLPTIFTIFKLPEDIPYKTIENKFSYFKKTFLEVCSKNENEIYFLGAPLADLGIVSQDYFFESLKKITHFYKKKQIIYILHRRENLDNMKKMFPNMKFVVYDNIIEIEFLLKKKQPIHIASFYSAALYTLHAIYNINNVDVFKLNAHKITHQYKTNIEKVYNLYNRFNIIDLENI